LRSLIQILFNYKAKNINRFDVINLNIILVKSIIKMAGNSGTTKQRALPKQGYSPDLNKYVAKKLRIKLNGGR
jgi:hypothetical protein